MGYNRTGKKTLDRMARDPRIEEIWMEDDGWRDDGRPSYWASLAPGYNWQGCTTLHEGTVKGLYEALELVEASIPEDSTYIGQTSVWPRTEG